MTLYSFGFCNCRSGDRWKCVVVAGREFSEAPRKCAGETPKLRVDGHVDLVEPLVVDDEGSDLVEGELAVLGCDFGVQGLFRVTEYLFRCRLGIEALEVLVESCFFFGVEPFLFESRCTVFAGDAGLLSEQLCE